LATNENYRAVMVVPTFVSIYETRIWRRKYACFQPRPNAGCGQCNLCVKLHKGEYINSFSITFGLMSISHLIMIKYKFFLLV